MRKSLLHSVSVLYILWAGTVLPAAAQVPARPKVRAVTAFVRLEREDYRARIAEALAVLRQARDAYQGAGYEVQTIRISTQPFPDYTQGLTVTQALAFFREYDRLARQEGFDAAIGPAMLRDADDPAHARLLAQVLASTTLNGSLVVADEQGVHWKSVRAAAELIKSLEEDSPHSQGNFNFAATAMLPAGAPFYPGSYHTGTGHEFAIALQSANVVEQAFSSANRENAAQALVAALGRQATAIEVIARHVEKQTGWKYLGIDLSPAPLKEVSIGAAIEKLSGGKLGGGGSMTAAAAITQALRAIPVQRAGYSGLMLPVLEDQVIAQRWSEGTLALDALLAYSAVCGTGLDTVPLPGDTTVEQLERIIGDVATLAFKLKKPLSARLMPVKGKKAGERTEFSDPFLVNATIQPLR